MALSRRQFLGRALPALAAGAALNPAFRGADAARQIPIIDTHVHFYDPTRPQGVPWPPKDSGDLYRPHLPPEFRSLTDRLNVVGVIVIEASPWLEDNQWVLDLARYNPLIVGFIGRLDLQDANFAKNLKRFAANPLFRGLRVDEKVLAGRDKEFLTNIQRLAERRMTMDVLGGAAMLPAVARVAKLAPDLRVVIDHLPFGEWDKNAEGMRTALREVADLPNVYAKISNVVRSAAGRVIDDLEVYRSGLDVLWELFGAERVLYGSNWPAVPIPYATIHQVVAEYLGAKNTAVAEKFFWRNSVAAYDWQPRGSASRLIRERNGKTETTPRLQR